MKKIFILPILLLFSCSTPKIIDFEKDYTQEIVGKVKSIDIKNYEYKFINKDTVILAKETIKIFDDNINIINEKIILEYDKKETKYYYQNGLLVEKKPISEDDFSKTTYKYDVNKNVLEEKTFDTKRVYHLKSKVYDKFNNPIEEHYSSFGKNLATTKIEYDYKKKFLVTKRTIDTFKLMYVNSRKDFNSKGYIIRSQSLNGFEKSDYYRYEIDKKGNLTKKIYYKADDTIIETITYKNTYDKKGNIIIRERFLNDKLIEKTTYEITYW